MSAIDEKPIRKSEGEDHMELMKVEKAGVEGVCAAFIDGLLAARYARELKKAEDDRSLLEAKVSALETMIRAKDKELRHLRKLCKEYRKERQDAREAAYRHTKLRNVDWSLQAHKYLVAIGVGMVLAFIIMTIILWIR